MNGYIDKTTASNLYWGGIAGIISKNDSLRLQILSNAYNTGKVKYGSSLETPIASGEKYEAKGKKYYYKVRAYNSASGKKVYGSWSEVKSYRR